MALNKVILLGNLTRDPEVRYTKSDVAYCKGGIAVNSKNKKGEDLPPMFIDYVVWDKRGEAFGKFHKKGQQALLEGELRLETWEDKDSGKPRSRHTLNVWNWEFVGGGKQSGGGVDGKDRDKKYSGENRYQREADYGNAQDYGPEDTPF